MACDVNIWEIFVFCSQFDWLKLSTLTIGKQWQILHYVGRTNIVLGVYMLRNFLSWDIPWLWVFVVFFSPTPEGHQWECRVCGGHHRHHWHLPRSARWVWKEWSRPPWWENTVWKRWTFAWGTLHNVEQKKPNAEQMISIGVECDFITYFCVCGQGLTIAGIALHGMPVVWNYFLLPCSRYTKPVACLPR